MVAVVSLLSTGSGAISYAPRTRLAPSTAKPLPGRDVEVFVKGVLAGKKRFPVGGDIYAKDGGVFGIAGGWYFSGEYKSLSIRSVKSCSCCNCFS